MNYKLQPMKDKVNTVKFDWNTRFYRIQDGTQRFRVLPNIDPDGIPVYQDFYVKVAEDMYVDCKDETCDLIRNINRLDKGSSTYKMLKPNERYQMQVLLLSDDGKRLLDPTPKMINVPKTAMRMLFETWEDESKQDLVICRKGTGPSTNYMGTGFVDAVLDLSGVRIGEVLPLDANKFYENRTWVGPVAKLFEHVGMELQTDDEGPDWAELRE